MRKRKSSSFHYGMGVLYALAGLALSPVPPILLGTFSFVERYHIGLAFQVAYELTHNDTMGGIATGFIVSEAFKDNPFGSGKPIEDVMPNLSLAMTLLCLLGVVKSL